MGGFWASELKHAGYDRIVICGKSSCPVYIWVNDDRVEIRDAGHLWGKDVRETQKILRQELKNDKFQILCIGPAGENKVYAASKHGVVGLSLSARVEGRARGVKVSVVCPGLVRTGIFDAARLVRLEGLPDLILPMQEPAAAAHRILRGVSRNRALIITPGWGRVFWWLVRVSPGLAMLIARDGAARVRRLRIDS